MVRARVAQTVFFMSAVRSRVKVRDPRVRCSTCVWTWVERLHTKTMLRRVLLCLLVYSLWWGCGKKNSPVSKSTSQQFFFLCTARSQLGPNDCVDTVSMSENLLSRHVRPGTVCIQCSVGGEVANDSIFLIEGSDIDASTGRVVDGVLVVFDTESVFTTSLATVVQCMSVNLNASHSVKMYLESKSQFHV